MRPCPRVLVERPQHRVVLECGREDVAAGLFSREKSLDEEVQGVRRVLGEDHVLGRAGGQEAGERLAGEGDGVLSLGAGGPARPEGGQGEGLPDGLKHLRRFRPARRGVVQVDDWLGGSHAGTRFSDDRPATTKKGSYRRATLIGAPGAGCTMAEMTAGALREAVDVLGVRERASLNEIRARYHESIRNGTPTGPAGRVRRDRSRGATPDLGTAALERERPASARTCRGRDADGRDPFPGFPGAAAV